MCMTGPVACTKWWVACTSTPLALGAHQGSLVLVHATSCGALLVAALGLIVFDCFWALGLALQLSKPSPLGYWAAPRAKNPPKSLNWTRILNCTQNPKPRTQKQSKNNQKQSINPVYWLFFDCFWLFLIVFGSPSSQTQFTNPHWIYDWFGPWPHPRKKSKSKKTNCDRRCWIAMPNPKS